MELNKDWFLEKINSFLSDDESNRMTKVDGSLIYEPDVLVGFVSGNDPIFEEYKKIIGEFHLTPKEVFEWYCKNNSLDLDLKKLTVVAFILPINEKTKQENLEYSKEMPSERWAHTRLFGEQANVKLQKYLIDELKKLNIHAIAPMSEKELFKINRKVWASNWSYRHMCFASGLGSFGLSDGFINEKGKAMRSGSIIINFNLGSDANKRPSNPYEYCNNCGSCIKRCPVGAISFDGRHDKQLCSKKVMGTIPFIKENYDINIYSCGLCQVGVPCQNGFPVDSKKK